MPQQFIPDFTDGELVIDSAGTVYIVEQDETTSEIWFRKLEQNEVAICATQFPALHLLKHIGQCYTNPVQEP